MYEHRNSKQKGDIAEAKVLTKLLCLGYSICKPIGDRLPYDLLVDAGDDVFIKIQVKSCFSGSTVRASQSRQYTKSKERVSYTEKSFDFLIVYHNNSESFYVVPVKDFVERKQFSIAGFSKHKYRKYSNYSANYLEKWNSLNSFIEERKQFLTQTGVTVTQRLHAPQFPCNSESATTLETVQ